MHPLAPGRLYLDHAATTPMLPAARRSDGGRARALGQSQLAACRGPRRAGRAGGRPRPDRARLWAGPARSDLHLGRERGDRASRSTARQGGAALSSRPSSMTRCCAPRPRRAIAAAGRRRRVDLVDLDAALARRERPLVAIQHVNNETGVHPAARATSRARVRRARRAAARRLRAERRQAAAARRRLRSSLVGAQVRRPARRRRAAGARSARCSSRVGGQEQGYRAGHRESARRSSAWRPRSRPTVAGSSARRALRARLDAAIVAAGGEVVAGDSAAHRHDRRLSHARRRRRRAADPASTLPGSRSRRAAPARRAASRPAMSSPRWAWSEAAAREVIRVSFGRTTDEADIDRFVARLARSCAARAARRERCRSISIIRRPRRSRPKWRRRCGLARERTSPTRTARTGSGREAAAAVEVGARPGPRRAWREAAAGKLHFTSGATEAANWALKGAAARLPEGRRRIVTLATEHACVLDTVAWLGRPGLRGRRSCRSAATGWSISTAPPRRSTAAPAWSRRCWSITRSA